MLPKVFVISIPILIVVVGSTLTFAREKTTLVFVQLAGAACLLVVVFAHFSEALDFLPAMGWGRPNTIGHYIDLVSATAGVVLLAVGYISRKISE